jgi:hypothetical protein
MRHLYISQMTLVTALFMHHMRDARPIRSYALKFHRERVPTLTSHYMGCFTFEWGYEKFNGLTSPLM